MITLPPKTWQLSAIISKIVQEIGSTVGRLIANRMWPVQSKSKKHEACCYRCIMHRGLSVRWTKFQREVPSFVEILKFPYNTVCDR